MIFNTAKEVNEYRKNCLCGHVLGAKLSLYKKNVLETYVPNEFTLEVLDKFIIVRFNFDDYSFKFTNKLSTSVTKDLNYKLYAKSYLNSIQIQILKECFNCNLYCLRFNTSINLAKNRLEKFSLDHEMYALYDVHNYYYYKLASDGVNMSFYETAVNNFVKLGSVSHENFLKMPFNKTYFITKLDKLKVFK